MKRAFWVVIGIAVVGVAYAAGTSALEKRCRRAVQQAGIAVQGVSVRPAWASLLRGRVGVELDLAAPQLSLRWSEGRLSGLALGSLRGCRAGKIPVVQIRMWEGNLSLLDQTVSPEVPWKVRHFALVGQADWRTGRCTFEGAGSLADGNVEKGEVKLQGSAILPQGPVNAEVAIAHNQLGDLAPYLRQVLGPAPSRGTAEVRSRVTLHAGVLVSQNDVTASGVAFPTDEATVLGPDGNRLVQLLQGPEGTVHLSFIVTGELGKGLDWSDLAAAAMREALRQAMARGIQRVLSDTEQQPVEEAVRKGLDSLGR